jgi:hypothetical protein
MTNKQIIKHVAVAAAMQRALANGRKFEWQIALHVDRWLVRATVLAIGSLLVNHPL